MEKYKVSIIVPIYNSEKYLSQCLNSIINQTYKNLEIILVDYGSIDTCGEIIKEYEKNDSRIITLFQKNFGAPSARNKGIEIATGTFIMFFDSDDELYEDAIENLVKNIKDADIVIGNFDEVDENDNPVVGDDNILKKQFYTVENINEIIIYNSIPGNKLFKSSIIKENGIIFDNVRIEQDTNFYIKYIGMSNKFVTTDNVIFKYRHTANSISRIYGLNLLDTIISVNKAIEFLKRNNKLSEEIYVLIKLSDYFGKIRRAEYFEKKYRKIILQAFIEDLKKIDIKKFSKELRKKYNRLLLKCRMCKYGVGIKLMNCIINFNIARKKNDNSNSSNF